MSNKGNLDDFFRNLNEQTARMRPQQANGSISLVQNVNKVDEMRKEGNSIINCLSILNFGVQHNLVSLSNDEKDARQFSFSKEFAFLKKELGIGANESLILSVVMNYGCQTVSMDELARMFDKSFLKIHQYSDAFLALEKLEYIAVRNDCVTRRLDAFNAISHNMKFVHIDKSGTPLEDLLEDYKEIAVVDNCETVYDLFAELNSKYSGHPFLKKIDSLILKTLAHYDTSVTACSSRDTYETVSLIMWGLVLNYVFNMFPCLSKYTFFDTICKSALERRYYVESLSYIINDSRLYGKWFSSDEVVSYIEFYLEDGMANPHKFVLSEKGAEFFGISSMSCGERELPQYNIRKSNSILPKELFYDEETKKQIDRLSGLLSVDNFNDIQKRLREHNMREGFNVLLYGAAGTGKTETCLQLSRVTGRDIYSVEVSDFKDKFVGESEKRIKGIFKIYDQIVNDYKKNNLPIPIMLLNEADAIIGIRKKGAENAVDKMENSIQNIILNEMENIKGILIATTNLTENLDSAFERRFIYKVKYSKPTKEVKMKIWQSNISTLATTEIEQLAEDYDFSGGEIENIVRKTEIEQILTGDTVSYQMINELAKSEKLEKSKERTKVGFTA